MVPSSDPQPVSYAERLWAPLWLWVAAAMWPLTLGIAYGYALGAAAGLVVGLGLAVLVGAGLLKAAVPVRMTATGLTIGQAFLEARYIGSVTALDAGQTKEVLGPSADARAFTVVRGWIHESVLVEVDDARDPTPYWIVSSRHARQLVSTWRAAASGGAHSGSRRACEDPSQQAKEV